MGGMSGRKMDHLRPARPALATDGPVQRILGPAAGSTPRHWRGIADTPIEHPNRTGKSGGLVSIARDAVVQRQLTAVPNANHFTDTRDNTARRFTPQPGNNGLTGTYTCQDNYSYHYDDATKQYRVVGAAAADTFWDVRNQVEQTRISTAADANGRTLHRYQSNGVRHYYHQATGTYRPMPQRAHWIDTNDRFVDNVNPIKRVLTPDGRGVDKQYGVAKDGRTFVVPYKAQNAPFLGGLPNIHGGNIDPHETSQEALARELRQESGNRYAVAVNHGLLLQHQNPANPQNPPLDANRYTINSIAVTPQANNHVVRHEMAGEFRFTASDFIGHAANDDATKAHLLHLFTQDRVGDPAHSHFLANLPQDRLDEWRGSHAMRALAGKIGADARDHEQGLGDARAGNPLPQAPSAERALGHQLYQQGASAARSGLIDQQQTEPAYRRGSQDYFDGLAAVKVNGAAQLHAGHRQAKTDYDEGIARARSGDGPEANSAGQDAHADYELGLRHAQGNAEAERATPAYLAGHGDAVLYRAPVSSAKRRIVDD